MDVVPSTFEARETFGLRRLMGAFWIAFAVLPLSALPILWGAEALRLSLLVALITGLGFVMIGILIAFPRRAPMVRLRVSAEVLWILPDQSQWMVFLSPASTAAEIPLRKINRIDDGGVFYSYRRLTIQADDQAVALNTTFLDKDLRRIIDAITEALKAKGFSLKEVIPVMQKRGGVWVVSTKGDALGR